MSNFDFCKKKIIDLKRQLENQKFGYQKCFWMPIEYLHHQLNTLYKKEETLTAGLFEETIALHDIGNLLKYLDGFCNNSLRKNECQRFIFQSNLLQNPYFNG